MRAAAFALLLVVGAACGGAGDETRSQALAVESRLVDRTLEQRVVDSGPGRPLLVLLHGRGMTPLETIWPELVEAVDNPGARAPTILFPDGGDHSYFHDRRDYAWGTSVLRAITSTQLAHRTDPERVAIGGFSMGGFGALDLARQRRFCAVGGGRRSSWRPARRPKAPSTMLRTSSATT
jgi:pimeloyl-ACP methyl ester carboxylesterase